LKEKKVSEERGRRHEKNQAILGRKSRGVQVKGAREEGSKKRAVEASGAILKGN